MRLRAVTLDAAGTLFEVAEPVGVTYARAAGRAGLRADPAAVGQRFVRALAIAPPLAFPGISASGLLEREEAWWRAVVAAALAVPPGAAFESCFEALFVHYASARAWRVFPDVPDAVRALRAHGLRTGVVSNFDTRLVKILDALGLAALLDVVIHSSAAGHAKPDPTIFAVALERLQTAPAETLHAGDSLAADVEGARAAGLGSVLVDRAGRCDPLPSGARRVGSLAELTALVVGTA